MKGVASCGISSREELISIPDLPSENRLKKGPVAAIECNQKIPCNPCQAACPRRAIRVRALTCLPQLDENRCNGCGSCSAPCQGLAVFVVDMTYSAEKALVMLPHELLPLPRPGQTVHVLDRAGNGVCSGSIMELRMSGKDDRIAVMSLIVPRKYGMEKRAAVPLDRTNPFR